MKLFAANRKGHLRGSRTRTAHRPFLTTNSGVGQHVSVQGMPTLQGILEWDQDESQEEWDQDESQDTDYPTDGRLFIFYSFLPLFEKLKTTIQIEAQ